MKRARRTLFLLTLLGVSSQVAASEATASDRAVTQKEQAGKAVSPRKHHRHKKAALLKTHAKTDKKHEEAAFPKLPPVASLLSTVSATLETLDAQAAALKRRTEEEKKQRNMRLSRQKRVFEAKLHSQEEENRAVVALSSSIKAEIVGLESSNTATRKRCKALLDDNRLMRAELRILQAKVASSQDFASLSLKATDDTGAPDLAVLQAPKSERSRKGVSLADVSEDDDSDESDADDSDDNEDDGSDGPTNFLSVSARVNRVASESAAEAALMASVDKELQDGDSEDDSDGAAGNSPPVSPRNLIKVLSQDVDSPSEEEKASETKLKALFLESFRAGTKRHVNLLTEQKTLNATRASLLNLKSKLHVAETHLEGTKDKLARRVRGFGLFVQKLAHLALAPLTETARGIKALPANVVIPPKKKEVVAATSDE